MPTAHSCVSGLFFSTYNTFGICFKWINEHVKPRMLLFSVGNGAMNALRNLQRRSECFAMLATVTMRNMILQIKSGTESPEKITIKVVQKRSGYQISQIGEKTWVTI
jgi:hypothetical protein